MRPRLKLIMLVMVVGLVWATGAIAQQVNPAAVAVRHHRVHRGSHPESPGRDYQSGQPGGFMGAR